MNDEEQLIGEDWSTPVEVTPGMDQSTPLVWDWKKIDASTSTKAEYHINHSDVSRVTFDELSDDDLGEDSQFRMKGVIPIVIIDSLDTFWAGESKSKLPLTGLRVPVSGDTLAEAKTKLAEDLAAQFRLLLILNSSMAGKLAPGLKVNLELYSSVLENRNSESSIK
tara:strand:- start:142 stop:639 length:498 start_codon:yes stop_codon:yes gene_type:complete